MIKLVLATHNENKVKEFNAILKQYGIKVVSLSSLKIDVSDAKETGKTFKANALIKAKYAAKHTKLPVIADDSGLCISALHNFPGIHSARYANSCGGFDVANQRLVNQLKCNRNAFFACAIALLNWEKKPIVLEAKVQGKIIDKFNNDKGFGYDPIFIPNGSNKAYNQLSKLEKNKISHRAEACKMLVDILLKKKK